MTPVARLTGRLALVDALVRGTALSSHLVTLSLVATSAGFGVNGILIAAFLQITAAGLIELFGTPKRERWSCRQHVLVASVLKCATPVLTLAAVALALRDLVSLAWLIFTLQAVIDGLAESSFNFVYVPAYQRWFEQRADLLGLSETEREQPFQRGHRLSLAVRLMFPLATVLLGTYWVQQRGVVDLSLAVVLLTAIFLCRLLVCVIMKWDLLSVGPLTPAISSPRAKNKVGMRDSVLFSLRYSPRLLLLYSFCTFLSIAVGAFLLGLFYRGQTWSGLESGANWLKGSWFVVGVQLVVVGVSPFVVPRLARRKRSRRLLRTYFALLAALSTLAGLAITQTEGASRGFILAVFSVGVLLLAQTGQRWLAVHIAKVPPQFRTTWFALGETTGFLLFGLVSGLLLISGFAEYAVHALIALCALTAIYFLISFERSRNFENTRTWTLERYLNAALIFAVAVFSVVGAVWETRSFVSEFTAIKGSAERAITSLFETAIREPVIQGALVESASQAQRLMSANPNMCVTLTVSGEALSNCDEWLNTHPLVAERSGQIYFDQDRRNEAGEYTIRFDRSDVYSSARNRFLIVLALFSAMGVIIWLAVRTAANRIFTELKGLLNWKSSDGQSAFLISEFSKISKNLKQSIQSELEAGNLRTVYAVNRQVAHDIRSPLTALAIVEKDLNELPEEKRVLLRGAMTRIRDIANGLLTVNASAGRKLCALDLEQGKSEEISTELLTALVETLMTEKRLQFRAHDYVEIAHHLTPDAYGLFARVQRGSFKRVVSNLINNAVEAIPSQGRVTVQLGMEESEIKITVCDNGVGIPADLLPKLGQSGQTYGKSDGNGLGLFHAKKSIEAWGGRMQINSRPGEGTEVHVYLPKVPAPGWFVEDVRIPASRFVVILDDDLSIHRVWAKRFSEEGKARGLTFKNFSTTEAFRAWVLSEFNREQPPLFLLDYEIRGCQESGFDVCQQLDLAAHSILVTSAFEDNALRERCQSIGLKLLPKSLAHLVPITEAAEVVPADAVLIDDDPLVHLTWETAAQASGKRLRAFSQPQDFFLSSNEIEKSTPIYIDSRLSEGQRGEEIARVIHDLGFTEIYLSTGFDPQEFADMAWIKGIIGKEPAF